jgi:predicted DsbA family dithiol-disulfide isomerase
MPEGGEDLGEHLGEKYSSTVQNSKHRCTKTSKARGAEVGFAFHPTGRGRVYNTFDAHRLLHWAEVKGSPDAQHRLKKAFLEAYQGRGEVIESHEVLLNIVQSLGMDVQAARAILTSDTLLRRGSRQTKLLHQRRHSLCARWSSSMTST